MLPREERRSDEIAENLDGGRKIEIDGAPETGRFGTVAGNLPIPNDADFDGDKMHQKRAAGLDTIVT